jgi:tetratricopeptide (TPR) repeat protein
MTSHEGINIVATSRPKIFVRSRIPVKIGWLLLSFIFSHTVASAEGIQPNIADRTSNARNHRCSCGPTRRHHTDSVSLSINSGLSQSQILDPSFKIEAYLFVGNQARDEGQYVEAKRHFGQMLAIDPNEWRAHYGLGNVSFDEAFLARDRNEPVAKSKSLMDNAIKEFNLAVDAVNLNNESDEQEKREVAELYSDLAQAYLQKSDFANAQKWVDKALELNRGCASAIRRQGSIYLSQYLVNHNEAKLNQALNKYDASLQIESENPLTHRARGAAYFQKFWKTFSVNSQMTEFFDKALAEFRKALALKPSFVAAYIDIGQSYFETRQYRQAIDPYRKALELNPLLAARRAELINSYCKLGDRASALREYEALKQLEAQKRIIPGTARQLESLIRGNCPAH